MPLQTIAWSLTDAIALRLDVIEICTNPAHGWHLFFQHDDSSPPLTNIRRNQTHARLYTQIGLRDRSTGSVLSYDPSLGERLSEPVVLSVCTLRTGNGNLSPSVRRIGSTNALPDLRNNSTDDNDLHLRVSPGPASAIIQRGFRLDISMYAKLCTKTRIREELRLPL